MYHPTIFTQVTTTSELFSAVVLAYLVSSKLNSYSEACCSVVEAEQVYDMF